MLTCSRCPFTLLHRTHCSQCFLVCLPALPGEENKKHCFPTGSIIQMMIKSKNIHFFKPKYGSLPSQEVCCTFAIICWVVFFFPYKQCLSFLIILIEKRAYKQVNTNTCKPHIIFARKRFSTW